MKKRLSHKVLRQPLCSAKLGCITHIMVLLLHHLFQKYYKLQWDAVSLLICVNEIAFRCNLQNIFNLYLHPFVFLNFLGRAIFCLTVF
jgi:hypothetical protein